jgi:hypothetical protein
MNPSLNELEHHPIYKIEIKGHLKEKWIAWLDSMVIEIIGHEDSNNTIIKVAIPDQAALRGILNKLWDLNLTLISVIQLYNLEGNANEN